MPLVYIVILNWNNCRDTKECLVSIKKIKYANFHTILVDNASVDNSVQMVKEEFPEVELIINQKNLGFAQGNNIGIKLALERKADYIFILNNDTVVTENVIDNLVNFAQIYGASTILAPKVYYYDKPKVINSLGTTLNWFRLRPNLEYCQQNDDGQFAESRKAQVLIGCALLFSASLIKKIGLFDESFYILHEDADLCLRNIKNKGVNITVPSAFIYHKSSAKLKTLPALTSYYSIRNFLYLACR
ncbi:MAG: glycosyltransferase family 2 protein, partial [Candidatus Omnitrophota bacterium]